MRLVGIRIENVGGFRTSELDLDGNRLLVGENNSGKTSVLRLLDWILNAADADLLCGRRPFSEHEQGLLVPARPTRNKARRLFVRVAIPDGRTARKYGAIGGVAELRIQFRSRGTYAKLTAPRRGEVPDTEPRALELLSALQACYCAVYIGAARDARSTVFRDGLQGALTSHFESVFLPQAGLPARERAVRTTAEKIAKVGENEAKKVWAAVQEKLAGVFTPESVFELQLDAPRLLRFMIEHVEPTFAFGEHDASRVQVRQLGAGTQSILAMALTQLSMANAQHKVLLLEEPEAFLHPSAQRTLAWQVFRSADMQIVATTHSPLVLAEARPSEVVVLHAHTLHPATQVDQLQEQKDQHQLSTWASGSMFDRSLLLVEGPGDVAFYEALRRKMAELLPVSVLSRIRVAAVGGKTSFGPWLRLLRRYRDPISGALAFSTIISADSADAGPDILRALRESSVTVPMSLQLAIKSIMDGFTPDALDPNKAEEVARRTRLINRSGDASAIGLHFAPVDLEYAATMGLSDARASGFASHIGWQTSTQAKLAAKLASKGGDGSASTTAGAKAPFIRAALADYLTWNELSLDIKDLLWAWVTPALDNTNLPRPRLLS